MFKSNKLNNVTDWMESKRDESRWKYCVTHSCRFLLNNCSVDNLLQCIWANRYNVIDMTTIIWIYPISISSWWCWMVVAGVVAVLKHALFYWKDTCTFLLRMLLVLISTCWWWGFWLTAPCFLPSLSDFSLLLSCLDGVLYWGFFKCTPAVIDSFCEFVLSIVHSSVLRQCDRSCRCFVFPLPSLPGVGCLCNCVVF